MSYTRCPSSQGVSLAVHELGGPTNGPTSSPTIIFCHATGLHGQTWAPVADELGKLGGPGKSGERGADFRCLALDFRGHGYSQTPEGVSFSWEQVTEDLLAVAKSVSLDSQPSGQQPRPHPLYAVGHSMGAAAIVHAKRSSPGLFHKVWLYEPILPPHAIPPALPTRSADPADPADNFAPSDNSHSLAQGARRRKYIFDSRAQALERYSSRPPLCDFRPDALRSYVDHGFVDLPDSTAADSADAATTGAVALRCHPEHEALTFEGVLPVDPDDLEQLDLNAKIAVSGDQSRAASFARHAAQKIPSAQLISFDQLGHFGPQQAPDVIAQSIADWFSS